MANKKYLWLVHFLNSPTIGRSSKRYIFMFLFQLPQVSRLRATVSTVMSGGMPSPAGAASPRWTAAGRGTTSCRTLDSVWMNGTGQALAGTSTYYLQIIHNSLNTHSSMYNKSSFFFYRIGLLFTSRHVVPNSYAVIFIHETFMDLDSFINYLCSRAAWKIFKDSSFVKQKEVRVWNNMKILTNNG